MLHTGAQWRELPERYGKWKSVHDRYNRWRGDGTIDRMLERLYLRLDEHGRIDVELWCIDATQIRASRAAAGAVGGKTCPASLRIMRSGAPAAASAPRCI
jgi:transposase